MRLRHTARAPVLAAGALAVSLAIAVPAIGGAIGVVGGGGQPPPGAPAVKNPGPVQEANNQPPAGAPAKSAGSVGSVGSVASPNNHPANTSPEKAGKPTQVSGADEKKSPTVRDRGGARAEKGGVNGADRKGGRKD